MKKIVYSGILKLVAVILFIAAITSAALVATHAVVKSAREDEYVYSLEGDFSESWYIYAMLDEAENLVFNAYQSVFENNNENDEEMLTEEDRFVHTNLARVAENIQLRFDNFYYDDKVDYFVQWNGLILSNCGAENAEELMRGESFSYLKREADGTVERQFSSPRRGRSYLMEELDDFDLQSTIIIASRIREETLSEYKALWEKQEGILMDAVAKGVVCLVAALIFFIYLLCVCGKNPDGEYETMWLDRIFPELHFVGMLGFPYGAVVFCCLLFDGLRSDLLTTPIAYWVIGTVAALIALVFITSTLSIVRNIKSRKLVESSLVLRVLRSCFRQFRKAAKFIFKEAKALLKSIVALLSKKTGVILIGMLFVYTAMIGFFGVGTASHPLWLVLGILLFGFASFVVAYRAMDMDEIKKGVSEVRSGNLSYKIPELKSEDLKLLAEDVNDIAKGLDESVSAKVKAERMKTELITNVSHDLKTPITSIINYTELLSKEELPEQARDYVAIIEKKSERLKHLTQDLFDISKVQSGNDNVVWEKLDVALLIQQAMGELDNEITGSGLVFCVEAPKDLYVFADGRKMSRVLSNLIQNILKYTLKGTRVFITATEKNGSVVLELKNVSAYPLDFDPDEITGRFVRGDESRSTEGNGLGLAIAKSYTEICNGSFEVIVDGDLFKTILKFKKYE